MRCFTQPIRKALFLTPLLAFPSPCGAFSSSRCPLIYKRQQGTHAIFSPSPRGPLLQTLSSSTERRSASSSSNENINTNIDPAEEKRIADEEAARQKAIGQAKRLLLKSVSREDRISTLEQTLNNNSDDDSALTKSERAELNGLLKVRDNFEEQYDPLSFTEEHLAFKAMHNDAFIALSRYCEQERNRIDVNNADDDKSFAEPINVFFLDGPEGGTASALIDRGDFNPSNCYVANRHESSCDALRVSGGGRLPDENVVHATAAEALAAATSLSLDGVEGKSAGEYDVDVATLGGGVFSDVDFAAYYFDGCGGFVPHVVGMMSAALFREDVDASSVPVANKKTIAVGFSLLGGNKDVVEKELIVCQALTIIARRRGMRMVHALDDPSRYGIPSDVKKVGGSGSGGTFTTWLLLEPDS